MDLKNYIKGKKLILPLKEDEIIKNIKSIKYICKKYNLSLEFNTKKKDIVSKELDTLKDIINSNNVESKITVLYTYVCNYLDTDMRNNNYCNFIDGKCIAEREKKNIKIRACCSYKCSKSCKYLVNNSCSTSNISCKLFMCSYLRKNKKYYKTKNIPLLKEFLNPIQMNYIQTCFFRHKEEVIKDLIKYNSMRSIFTYLFSQT